MTDSDSSRERAEPPDPHPGDPARLLPPAPDDSTVLLSWPVGTVAEQVGVSTSTLRSWERRYGLGPTRRTGGNHRRYGPTDVFRVRLMARLTAQGIPARAAADSIAGMDDRAVVARLQAPAIERSAAIRAEQERSAASGAGIEAGRPGEGSRRPDGAAAAPSRGLPGDKPAPASPMVDVDAVESIVAAASALDARSLVHLYRAALRRLDFDHAWTDVLAPSLREIGERWATGRLGVESEHLASDVLQSELRAVTRAQRTDATGAPVLLVAADDEQHHLPLLALEAELARYGVPTLHLGPRVPAQAVVETMRRTGARAVFVWASMTRVPSEAFWGLLDEAALSADIVVGGPGWPEGVEDRLRDAAVCRVADLSAAVDALLPRDE